jgi:peptidoglycan-associated lipoprotein
METVGETRELEGSRTMKRIDTPSRLLFAVAIGMALAGCSHKPAAVGATSAGATPAGSETWTEAAPEPVRPAREVVTGAEGDVAGGGRVQSTDLLSGATGGLVDVYFSLDDSRIEDDQKAALDANAQILKDKPGVKVVIEGYCDERGTGKYNMTLGQFRADTARAYLVALGVESARISTISYGKERPDPAGHDEAAWRLNRRAHFVVTPKEGDGAKAVAIPKPKGSM